MAQDETAVQHKSQGMPASGRDQNPGPIDWQSNVLPDLNAPHSFIIDQSIHLSILIDMRNIYIYSCPLSVYHLDMTIYLSGLDIILVP